ncbi:HNH endonuclease [Geotalea toluenoxydans]|uniref:HNH endonuclease n=1 Tax=Geotalea toluenoxydans TaxID=421624 RepID=UPI0006D211AA|nr:HNH endonuclease [Geotalea toluenoxydans]
MLPDKNILTRLIESKKPTDYKHNLTESVLSFCNVLSESILSISPDVQEHFAKATIKYKIGKNNFASIEPQVKKVVVSPLHIQYSEERDPKKLCRNISERIYSQSKPSEKDEVRMDFQAPSDFEDPQYAMKFIKIAYDNLRKKLKIPNQHIGIIMKLSFGEKSDLYPETYLQHLLNLEKTDESWNLPRNPKALTNGGKKILIYDPERKGITAEFVVEKIIKTDREKDFPWSCYIQPYSLKIFDPHIGVDLIEGIEGLENLASARQAYRNVSEIQYAQLQSVRTPDQALDEVLEDISEIEQDKNINSTEKEALIKARLGQGKFREYLVSYWKECAITKCNELTLLRASHIKPWRCCDNIERLDKFNGLLLTPNLDAAFDKGYVTFKDDGHIVISSALNNTNIKALGIDDTIMIPFHANHKKYIEFHRENIFKR